MASDDRSLDAIRRAARPLRDDADVEAVLGQVGDAETVLLGEATHGTHEFYATAPR